MRQRDDDDDDHENNRDGDGNRQRDALTPAGNPLPHVVHATVLSTDADDADADANNDDANALRWLNPRGRLIVVGDVHGCDDAFERLLAAVRFVSGVDNLVLCGDAVTKGPDSRGVVDRAMALGALCSRGNHDDGAVAAAKGATTDQQSPDYVPDLGEKQLQWLAALPFTIRFPHYGVVVAHAGLVPGVPRAAQALRDVTVMRELVAVGAGKSARRHWRALEEHEAGSVPWAPEWRGPGHVLFGHDSPRGLQRERAATGLDTGCVHGGRLTCAVLPSLDELLLLQSRKRRRSWWSCWWCFGAAAADAAAIPRTPRFERDLGGRIVSVAGLGRS